MSFITDSKVFVVSINHRNYDCWKHDILRLKQNEFSGRMGMLRSYFMQKAPIYVSSFYTLQGQIPGVIILAEGWERNPNIDIVQIEAIFHHGWRVYGDKYHISGSQWARFKKIEQYISGEREVILEPKPVPIQKISRFDLMDI